MTYWDTVPDYSHDKREKKNELRQSLGREPSDRELYGALSLSKAQFYRWEKKERDALAVVLDIQPNAAPASVVSVREAV